MKRKLGAFTAFLGLCLFLGMSSDLCPETIKMYYRSFRAQDMVVLVPEREYQPPPPTPTPNVLYEAFQNSIDEIEIEYTDIEYEYIGTYYITAYCPAECGYNGDNYPTGWMTASGEICHRADHEDRLTEPTTCAIDRHYHSFGDMFYIEEFDRVFVAEDTGAFSGRWLDLFYEDYEDVLSFPTGYYTVYSVKYVTKTVKAQED